MTSQAARFIGSIPQYYDEKLGPVLFADFATGLVCGNPLFEEIVARGGDPAVVCTALAAALDASLGNSMPLRAIVIEAYKD